MAPSSNRQRRQQQLPARQSLVISAAAAAAPSIVETKSRRAIAGSLLVLVCCWFVCFVLLVARSDGIRPSVVHDVHGQMKEQRQHFRGLRPFSPAEAKLLSRIPNKVIATADVRGNLGPASVVLQAGTDWIHDRWQAASNMHGKQIPGEHWIQLEFVAETIVADTIVLDWETAYADEYVLEASLEPISGNKNNNNNNNNNNNTVWTLFDGRNHQDVETMRSVTESGRSPGVKEPRPLHVVHEIRLGSGEKDNRTNRPFRFLRLHILKSKTGWGVSLWQFDVYGFSSDELQTSR